MKIFSPILVVASIVTASGTAMAGTLHVANNGLDSPSCGAYAAPCRSLFRAIENASAGDTLLVRPGRYGDLNRDGELGGPGEEINASGRAAVWVTKPLRILSTEGAEATVIDGGGGARVFGTVLIASNNVVFGDVGAGFHLTGGESGVLAEGNTNTRIVGNIASAARAHGFWVYSSGYLEISHNVAHDNFGAGFIVGGLVEANRAYVHHNKSYSNGSGIVSATYGRNEVAYNEVTNNVGTGIQVDFTPSYIHHNFVSGNDHGISPGTWSPERLPSAGPVISRNSLAGNTRFGIMVIAGPIRTTLRENNFYGNGVSNDEFGRNCGLANFTGAVLNAPNNYWGASTGPGAEPADVACGNDPVITTPFARNPN